MVLMEMKLIPLLEMRRTIYQQTKGAFGHSKDLSPYSLLKTCMRIESKEAS
jgi:hypothetical protein